MISATISGLKYPSRTMTESSSTCSAISFNSSLNQVLIGILNGLFLRLQVLRGRISCPTFFNIYFSVIPFNFKCGGMVAANSTTLWSIIGTLASIELDMVSLSVSSNIWSTRYDFVSAYIIRSRKPA